MEPDIETTEETKEEVEDDAPQALGINVNEIVKHKDGLV